MPDLGGGGLDGGQGGAGGGGGGDHPCHHHPLVRGGTTGDYRPTSRTRVLELYGPNEYEEISCIFMEYPRYCNIIIIL